MGWRRAFGGALLLALAACGGTATPCLGEPDVRLSSVVAFPDRPPLYGKTVWDCDGPTHVFISMETPPELLNRAVAHELLHAAGLVDHEASTNCYLYEIIFGGQPLEPCLHEVTRLKEITGSFVVTVESAELMDAAIFATELWNEEAEREVFTLALGE